MTKIQKWIIISIWVPSRSSSSLWSDGTFSFGSIHDHIIELIQYRMYYILNDAAGYVIIITSTVIYIILNMSWTRIWSFSWLQAQFRPAMPSWIVEGLRLLREALLCGRYWSPSSGRSRWKREMEWPPFFFSTARPLLQQLSSWPSFITVCVHASTWAFATHQQLSGVDAIQTSALWSRSPV